MAAARRVGNSRHLISLIVSHLSNMTYMVRCQRGPDQPVECHEFRPTLVPAILVNSRWADVVTSILWKRYPNVLALSGRMTPTRRQWYTEKVERLLLLGQSCGDPSDLACLQDTEWPNLKTLEIRADWKTYEKVLMGMTRQRIEHVELFGPQSGGSKYFMTMLTGIAFLLCSTQTGYRLRFGPDVTDPDDPVSGWFLQFVLTENPNIRELGIMNFSCSEKDELIKYLCHRKGLQALEIDFDPGLELLSLFAGSDALRFPFASLLRLDVLCYPEIALALIPHLLNIQHIQLTIGRIPDHEAESSDLEILNKLIDELALAPELRTAKIHICQLSRGFPSASAHPMLSGLVLADLTSGCPMLQEVTFSALEPAAIDGGRITAEEFERFCKHAPHLRVLDLKFLPNSIAAIESSAFQHLGTHCPKLEILRLKGAFHLPSLPPSSDPEHTNDDVSESSTHNVHNPHSPPAIMLNGESCIDYHNLEASIPSSHQPLFQNLSHLAIARPCTILSVANEAPSPAVDPSMEEDLVGTWAQRLLGNFPSLEILEAWGDWRVVDNESLNYFLPREEILATTWEFLSGVEQDLWDYGGDAEDASTEVEYPFRSRRVGEDWKRASLVNEYPE